MIRAAVCCTVLLAGAAPLLAQDASLLVGASRVRYADSLDGTAGYLGARLSLGRGMRAGALEGAYSSFRGGGWAVQAGGRGTVLFPAGRALAVGIAAGASLNDYEGGVVSGTGAAGPVLAVRAGRSQVVLGLSGGAFRSIDTVWSPIGSGSLRWNWSPAAPLLVDAGVAASIADSLRFADLTLQLRFGVSRVRGGVTGGVRLGDLADGPWGSVDVAWDVAGPVTLEAAAGRYPRDLTGFADGLYAQGGIRVFALRAPPAVRAPPVDVRRIAEGRVRLTLRYRASGNTLQLAGAWNGWTPLPMRREGGDRWSIDLTVEPGVYTFALLDGDRWVLPAGAAGVDDGFGGTVALLTIP